nr:putative mitochondrial protein [Tanacetum cinerariifolium]
MAQDEAVLVIFRLGAHLIWQFFGGPGDFLVHHAIALGLHTTTLILVKGALDARGSKLMPDKKDFGSVPWPRTRRTLHYGRELIETLAWAHERTPLANLIRWREKPVALSIVQARLLRLAHFSVEIVVLTSDSSDDNKGVSSEEPSITSIPKEGPSIPFVVEADVSGFGIRAILLQNKRAVAYFRQVLDPRARLKSVYERELMAIVLPIRRWRPYLLGTKFIVRIDQRSLKYLLEQRLVSEEHQRWLSKLVGYDFEIQYRPKIENRVADALSSRGEDPKLAALSIPWVID